MISEFGICMHEIREKRHMSLRTMAKGLDISAAFLSAMEVGKKTIPLDYIGRISDIFSLSPKEKDELEDSVRKTNKNIDLSLSGMNKEQGEVALVFARKIHNADPDLLEKLKALLNDKDKGDDC